MTEYETERDLLGDVRDRLDGWIYEAREEAFEELFEGPDAVLSDDEVRLLDRIDSRMSREQGQGLWNADGYAIVETGEPDEETTPRVVCTSYPQVPASVYPSEEAFAGTSRSKLDDALWQYCQRVVEIAQQRLDEVVLSAEVASREE